jgi:hypothetical protein
MLLALHRPYAFRSLPEHCFSQNICLNLSLAFLEMLIPPSSQQVVWSQLQNVTMSGGAFLRLMPLMWPLLFALSSFMALKLGTWACWHLDWLRLGRFAWRIFVTLVQAAGVRINDPRCSGKAYTIPPMTLAYLQIIEDIGINDESLAEKLQDAAGHIFKRALCSSLSRPDGTPSHVVPNLETAVNSTNILESELCI